MCEKIINEFAEAKSPDEVKNVAYVLGFELDDAQAEKVFEAFQARDTQKDILADAHLAEVLGNVDPTFARSATWSEVFEKEAQEDFSKSGYDEFGAWFFDRYPADAWCIFDARNAWLGLDGKESKVVSLTSTWWGAKKDVSVSEQ